MVKSLSLGFLNCKKGIKMQSSASLGFVKVTLDNMQRGLAKYQHKVSTPSPLTIIIIIHSLNNYYVGHLCARNHPGCSKHISEQNRQTHCKHEIGKACVEGNKCSEKKADEWGHVRGVILNRVMGVLTEETWEQ